MKKIATLLALATVIACSAPETEVETETQQYPMITVTSPWGELVPVNIYAGQSNITGPWHHWVVYQRQSDGACWGLILQTGQLLTDDVTIWGSSADDYMVIGNTPVTVGCTNQPAITLHEPNRAPAKWFILQGKPGNDTIACWIPRCELLGGSGNDTLMANSVATRLWGGADNDRLIHSLNPGSGSNGVNLLGGLGNDCLQAPNTTPGNGAYSGDDGTDSCTSTLGFSCEVSVPGC